MYTHKYTRARARTFTHTHTHTLFRTWTDAMFEDDERCGLDFFQGL